MCNTITIVLLCFLNMQTNWLLSLPIWEGVRILELGVFASRLSVCLSACLCVCLSVNVHNLKLHIRAGLYFYTRRGLTMEYLPLTWSGSGPGIQNFFLIYGTTCGRGFMHSLVGKSEICLNLQLSATCISSNIINTSFG